MPTAPSKTDSLDNVDEAFRPLYREQDGHYVLQVEDIRNHPQVLALQNAHEAQKEKNRSLSAQVSELQAQVEKFKDVDVEEYAHLKANADPDAKNKTEAVKAEFQKLLEQRVKAVEADKAKEIDALKAQLDQRVRKHHTTVVQNDLTSALVKANVDPDLMEAASAMLTRYIKVAENERGNEVALVETDMGLDVPVEKYVAEWIQSDKGSAFRARPAGADPRGGRVNGSGEPNPFDGRNGKKVNLTAAQELISKDPNKARAMAQAVGYPVNW